MGKKKKYNYILIIFKIIFLNLKLNIILQIHFPPPYPYYQTSIVL